MTFDEAAGAADQEIELVPDFDGTIEYATKYESYSQTTCATHYQFVLIRIVKFSSVTHLTLHFPTNYGDETSRIYFIGLKGDWTPAHQHGVTLCTYEATPSMSDHKDKILETSNMNIH